MDPGKTLARLVFPGSRRVPRVCDHAEMRLLVSALLAFMLRRGRPLGLAFAVYDAWRRLPPAHRRQLLLAARRHGPRLAAAVARRTRPRR
jgi:hypothetical protein